MDPLIKSQLLYQLSYAPFPNLDRPLGNTRDHTWCQLARANARVHIALGWFFVEGVEAGPIGPARRHLLVSEYRPALLPCQRRVDAFAEQPAPSQPCTKKEAAHGNAASKPVGLSAVDT